MKTRAGGVLYTYTHSFFFMKHSSNATREILSVSARCWLTTLFNYTRPRAARREIDSRAVLEIIGSNLVTIGPSIPACVFDTEEEF